MLSHLFCTLVGQSVIGAARFLLLVTVTAWWICTAKTRVIMSSSGDSVHWDFCRARARGSMVLSFVLDYSRRKNTHFSHGLVPHFGLDIHEKRCLIRQEAPLSELMRKFNDSSAIRRA